MGGSGRCAALCAGVFHRHPVACSASLSQWCRTRSARGYQLLRAIGAPRGRARGKSDVSASACISQARRGEPPALRRPAADYGSTGSREAGAESGAHVSGSCRKNGKKRRSSSSSCSSTAAGGGGSDFPTTGRQPSAHQNGGGGGRGSGGPDGGAIGHPEGTMHDSQAVVVVAVARLAVVTTARRRRGRESLEPLGRPMGRGPANMAALRCGISGA